jgi:hypothetical protein
MVSGDRIDMQIVSILASFQPSTWMKSRSGRLVIILGVTSMEHLLGAVGAFERGSR